MLIPALRNLLRVCLAFLPAGIFPLTVTSQVQPGTAYRLNLQARNGKFLSATRGTELTVQAIVDNANLDELFVVTDENGGSLQNGDPVRLYAHTGYITIDAGDGLMKASRQPAKSAIFTVVKVGGSGIIGSNDQIMLQTSDGAYLTLQSDGKIKAVSGAGQDTHLIALTGVSNVNIQNAFSDNWNFGYYIEFDEGPQGQFGRQLQHSQTLAKLRAPGAPATPVPAGSLTRTAVPSAARPPAHSFAVPPTPGLPAFLPEGHYKCLVDHIPNVWNAGYFSILPGNKYIFHGFDANKRDGVTGSFSYDRQNGKIVWLSGSWKTNNYYGIYSLDNVMGNRIYLIPEGSDYSACKCFLQRD